MANKTILTDILEKCIFVNGKISLLHKNNTHYNCELFPQKISVGAKTSSPQFRFYVKRSTIKEKQ